MPRTLVIAIGNTLRSDDGFAWHVAEELTNGVSAPDRVLKVLQLTPELAEEISSFELIIFVDAAAHGEPGVLTCDPLTSTESDLRYSHDFSPATLIEMAKTLYGREPEAFVVCAGGKEFAHGETLSPEVAGAVPAAAEKVRELVANAG